ncbi:MAG: hypothetical protein COA78_25675 [Blastopirellula sp.]|nr:MAG: hypothetical protein COA78_25675 [Blastopirellula sp.]
MLRKIKRNPKRFVLYVWLHFVKLNKEAKKLLLIPTYVTVFIIIFALSLAIDKGFNKLTLNEVGDFFAGFAGVIAFLWIIVTVLLQNRDLNLQYQEIKDLKVASVSQARSLLSAEVFKALEYVNQQFSQKYEYLEARRECVDQELKDFMVKYPSDRSPQTLFKAKLDIGEVWGYFKKQDVKTLYLEIDDIKEDFDYEAYLKLQTINYQIGLALGAIDAIAVNVSSEIENQIWQNILTMEQQLMIEWYRDFSPILKHMEKSVIEAIVKYEIGSSFNRQFIKAFSSQDNND